MDASSAFPHKLSHPPAPAPADDPASWSTSSEEEPLHPASPVTQSAHTGAATPARRPEAARVLLSLCSGTLACHSAHPAFRALAAIRRSCPSPGYPAFGSRPAQLLHPLHDLNH